MATPYPGNAPPLVQPAQDNTTAPVIRTIQLSDLNEALRLGSTRSEATTPLVPDYKPQTAAGRFANRAAEEVGATMVPVAAAGGAAAGRARRRALDRVPSERRRVPGAQASARPISIFCTSLVPS